MHYKTMTSALMMASVLTISAGNSQAATLTIAGPTIDNSDDGYRTTGIEFQALQNSTLTDFTFNYQGKNDTIELLSSTGTVLDQIDMLGARQTSRSFTVSWALAAGADYYLVQTSENNARFSYDGSLPANANMKLLNSSLFSQTASIFDAKPVTYGYWADFNNITTSTPVPLPAAVWLLLSGIGGLGAISRKRQFS